MTTIASSLSVAGSVIRRSIWRARTSGSTFAMSRLAQDLLEGVGAVGRQA